MFSAVLYFTWFISVVHIHACSSVIDLINLLVIVVLPSAKLHLGQCVDRASDLSSPALLIYSLHIPMHENPQKKIVQDFVVSNEPLFTHIYIKWLQVTSDFCFLCLVLVWRRQVAEKVGTVCLLKASSILPTADTPLNSGSPVSLHTWSDVCSLNPQHWPSPIEEEQGLAQVWPHTLHEPIHLDPFYWLSVSLQWHSLLSVEFTRAKPSE